MEIRRSLLRGDISEAGQKIGQNLSMDRTRTRADPGRRTNDEVDYVLRSADSDDKEFIWWLPQATMREYVDQTWGWDESWQRIRFDEYFNPTALQIIEVE